MVECTKVNVKLTDAQLKTLRTAVKDKTGTTLRMTLKMVKVVLYYYFIFQKAWTSIIFF